MLVAGPAEDDTVGRSDSEGAEEIEGRHYGQYRCVVGVERLEGSIHDIARREIQICCRHVQRARWRERNAAKKIPGIADERRRPGQRVDRIQKTLPALLI